MVLHQFILFCFETFAFFAIFGKGKQMSSLEDFVQAPSVDVLDTCEKEQVLEMAEHYKVEIRDKRWSKGRIKILLDGLVAQKVLPEEENLSEPEEVVSESKAAGKTFSFSSGLLSFEQQKQLLVLKLEHEKEIEKLKQKTELLKLELEHEKLKCSIDETQKNNIGACIFFCHSSLLIMLL